MFSITDEKSFEVKFKSEWFENFSQSTDKVALLVTTEYEGFFKNGGIGTYYAHLSQKLAAEGWYIILVLCYTEDNFGGKSEIPALKHVFSTHEVEQVLELQPIHHTILAELKQNDSLDYQSFCCLFFTQAVVSSFRNSDIYVEFPEMCGLGYRTIQAKKSAFLGENCITAVTLHSGHEWVYEANENYLVSYPFYFWHACHSEQHSYESADLAFFPSYYLKSKVESYGWRAANAIHLPYFVPIIKLSQEREALGIHSKNEEGAERIPIVFFGRLEERKGICEFLEAIKSLDSSFQERIDVIFLGKIVQLQSVKLKHLNSQEYIDQEFRSQFKYIIFPDFSSKEAIQFVSDLHCPIVCLTSPQDNFPNSALEMGQLPVSLIASDTGGFRETLKLLDRTSGVRWFEPGNSRPLSMCLSQAILAYPETPRVPERVFLEQVNQSLMHRRLKYIEEAFTQSKSLKLRQPKVTIGVTCFNLGKYLFDCLKSLNEQTYSNLEIIVLDDASDDKYTQEIIEQAKSLFLSYKFIRLDNNIGLGAARNYLVEIAEGDYFIPFDADNVALPFMVEKFVNATCRWNADAVVCSQMKFGEVDSFLSFAGGPLPTLLKSNKCGDACSLFSIELLREFKHSEDRKVVTHDWQILSTAVATGKKIAYFPYPLYLYRVRYNSMLASANFFRDQYHLRQYLAQVEPSKWTQRQLYMLLSSAQQLINELERSQTYQQQTQVELERSQAQVQQTQAEVGQARAEVQAELAQTQLRIEAMETSKFWKLRKAWFRLRQALGLGEDE